MAHIRGRSAEGAIERVAPECTAHSQRDGSDVIHVAPEYRSFRAFSAGPSFLPDT